MAIARVTEITSGSTEGFDAAIRAGIERASKTLENIQQAWVKEQYVVLDGPQVKEYRVNLKITFLLKD